MNESSPGAWTVVVPVKGTSASKSRLGGEDARRERLAAAIALDTVETVLATPGVVRVVVVTSASAAPAFAALGADTVLDAAGEGLNAAIRLGVSAAEGAVGVLLGDLPALRTEELAAALGLAAGHPRALVPDADDVGTVLITARAAGDHDPAFGGGSRRKHLDRGYVELDLPATSGLRRDVDTPEQLAALERLGPRTAALA